MLWKGLSAWWCDLPSSRVVQIPGADDVSAVVGLEVGAGVETAEAARRQANVTKQNHCHMKEKTFLGSMQSVIVQNSWKTKSAPWALSFHKIAQKNVSQVVIVSELGRLMQSVHFSAGHKQTLFPFCLCINLRTW